MVKCWCFMMVALVVGAVGVKGQDVSESDSMSALVPVYAQERYYAYPVYKDSITKKYCFLGTKAPVEGYVTLKDAQGEIISEGAFHCGKETGEWISYWDGSIKMIGHYRAGNQEGYWKYYVEGNLYSEGNYKNGLEEGLWKRYNTFLVILIPSVKKVLTVKEKKKVFGGNITKPAN